MQQVSSPSIQASGDIAVNIQSFIRHLRAENLSPKTIETYSESTRQLASFLASAGMPQDVAHISREHIESFITSLLERWKPATANNRFRGIQSFFKWLAEEGEIKESPMARMKPPKVPEQAPPVLQESELRAMLATCEKGNSLEERRDHALLRLFMDTGARRAEVAGIRFDLDDDSSNDLDLDHGIVRSRCGHDLGGLRVSFLGDRDAPAVKQVFTFHQRKRRLPGSHMHQQ